MQFNQFVCKTLKIDSLIMVYAWYILDGFSHDASKLEIS